MLSLVRTLLLVLLFACYPIESNNRLPASTLKEPFSAEVERDSIVAQEARRAGVPVRLALAVARVENPSADSMAVSKAGAVGLMQVLPRFWQDAFLEECGTGSLFERQRNACVGVRVLRHYLRRNVSVDRALRGYHGSLDYQVSGNAYVAEILEHLARLAD